VEVASPAAALKSQLFPQLPGVEVAEKEVASVGFSLNQISSPKAVPAAPSNLYVLIYSTHTGETYALTDGVERLEGRPGGVVTAAAALQEALKERRINAFRSDRVHDVDYGAAYLESEKTAAEMLAAHPDACALLDIHRDSGKTRAQSVVTVNGKRTASVLLVVGTGGRRLPGSWSSNYEFARALAGKMDQLYPGLCAGVRLKDGRYNQHLHPRALLVEIGTSQNSTEEAVAAAEMLADALAELLKRGV